MPALAATKKPSRKVSVQTWCIGEKCHTWNGPWCWGHRMGPRKWLGSAQSVVENPLPSTLPPGGSICNGSWWWHNADIAHAHCRWAPIGHRLWPQKHNLWSSQEMLNEKLCHATPEGDSFWIRKQINYHFWYYEREIAGIYKGPESQEEIQ